ncbi:MAG: DUF4292 domain-containing protein [Crocinitomicaceae bacterium]|jgi:DNA replication protein DnaD|nr:DUF4292 domain-containing protein [Crocinitomicaceae bacterium]
MKNILIQFSSLALGLALLSSCAKKLTEGDGEKVKRMKTQDLVANMDSLVKVTPSTFYSKISTKYKDSTRSLSFKNSLRMIQDSALNSIITYASIPVVNALITKDSLSVVNKRDKCLVRADLNFLRDNFGVDFTFRNIEELIFGKPLDFDNTLKYFQIHEPFQYVLSSHRKMKIKRLDKDNNRDRRKEEEENIVFKYFIDSTGRQLSGMEIFSPNDTARIVVRYLSRQLVGAYNLPEEVELEIYTPKNTISMRMSYDRAVVDEPQTLYFIIPEGYEDCE